MSHEGAQIIGVRQLTEDEALGDFPAHRETIAGLELDDENIIFPTGDEEGNMVGEWPVPEDQLEEYVGMYVVHWRNPNDPDERQVHADRDPIHLVIGEEPPTIHDNNEIEFNPSETIELAPGGRGVGPAAWHLRDESERDDRPDPETTPTPEEVMEMYENGEIASEDFSDRLHEAENAHNDATFAGIY